MIGDKIPKPIGDCSVCGREFTTQKEFEAHDCNEGAKKRARKRSQAPAGRIVRVLGGVPKSAAKPPRKGRGKTVRIQKEGARK